MGSSSRGPNTGPSGTPLLPVSALAALVSDVVLVATLETRSFGQISSEKLWMTSQGVCPVLLVPSNAGAPGQRCLYNYCDL